MKLKGLFLICLLGLLVSCHSEQGIDKTQKNTLFIGIDVSGSFTRSKSFKDSLGFLSHYIYGHINEKSGLSRPTDLYVGGVGGNQKEDPLTFFPIHDFLGLSPSEIEQKLEKEFSGHKDNLTDFNTFFERIRSLVKQKNLVLAPISIVLITDGVPEIAKGSSKQAIIQAYSKINLEPLEYLARNISLRLLYVNPKVGHDWRHYVPTKRVRIWTVEPKVMFGWKDQLERRGEEGLYTWVKDNIDLRIRSKGR